MCHCSAWPTGQRMSASPCSSSVGVVTSATRVNGDIAASAAPSAAGDGCPNSHAASALPSSEVPIMLVRSLTAPPATAAANRPSLLVR